MIPAIIIPFFLVAWEFVSFNLLLRGQAANRTISVHGIRLENAEEISNARNRGIKAAMRTKENGRKSALDLGMSRIVSV